MVCDADYVTFRFLIDNLTSDAKGVGVERSLWDQAIGKGNAEDACEAGGAAEEEDVPVEAGWLSERKFCALCYQG
jgi:hypothetical protein